MKKPAANRIAGAFRQRHNDGSPKLVEGRQPRILQLSRPGVSKKMIANQKKPY